MVANEATQATINPDDVLARRGLTSAANDAGWKQHANHGVPGWVYPVYQSNGKPLPGVKRWKAADSSANPKCLWFLDNDKKPPKYYLFGDTLKAIKAKNGVCYLASGEPDVLAYRAAGIKNVFSWFGESSIPDSLIDDLKYMGVTTLNDYPDRDETGLKKAARLMELLKDTDIVYMAYQLPGDDDSKYDINQLWIEKEFDARRFESTLLDCSQYQEGDLAFYLPVHNLPKTPEIAASDEWTPNQSEAIEKVAFARFAADLKVYMEREYSGWQGDGWSKNKPCPFHDDKSPSAGVNRDSLTFKCFVCGTMDAKEYGSRVGIEYQHYVDKVADEFRANPLPASKPANVVSLPTPTGQPDKPTYTDSDVALKELASVLRGESLPDYTPMAFPYKVFHRFGGFAKLMMPGKLVYVMGVSGGGKTSFLEAAIEALLKDGKDAIVYSPEWSPVESRKRSVQRAGGMTVTEMNEFELWQIEAKRGIPVNERTGSAPSKERLDHTLRIIDGMGAWKGKAAQFNQDIHFTSMAQLEDEIEKVVEDKRAAGREVAMLGFDYIQKAPKSGYGEWDRLEMASSVIKGICERNSLYGWVLIQPRKDDSKATRDGKALTEAAAQGLSDQQANLFITVTPEFEDDGSKKPFVRANVVKNSLGETGEVCLKVDWRTLAIWDAEQKFKTESTRSKAGDYSPEERSE